MVEWNTNDKISTVAMDKYSTNDAMVSRLKEKLYSTCNLLDEKLLHMRCCAYILNLIVNDDFFVISGGIERINDSVVY